MNAFTELMYRSVLSYRKLYYLTSPSFRINFATPDLCQCPPPSPLSALQCRRQGRLHSTPSHCLPGVMTPVPSRSVRRVTPHQGVWCRPLPTDRQGEGEGCRGSVSGGQNPVRPDPVPSDPESPDPASPDPVCPDPLSLSCVLILCILILRVRETLNFQPENG